ncbi:hypothetical protein KCTCHS21_18480 [Cohnella abietis]|uniref:Uncharacterized protein n=1 Tax=Cohnella abietis TaxID=2507935 RepID=A0A3T1D347_9BACL|nr:hypothetical protein KCTCHS21_18480 [Cohnella abietis]
MEDELTILAKTVINKTKLNISALEYIRKVDSFIYPSSLAPTSQSFASLQLIPQDRLED